MSLSPSEDRKYRTSKHVLLLLVLCLRDHDDGAVAERIGDEGQADPGVAGSSFDHDPARLELAASLRVADVTGRLCPLRTDPGS